MGLSIRLLEINDVSEQYVEWFSNKKVVRYSDNQYRSFTLSGQKEYVLNCINSDEKQLYGIFYDLKHIGNIELSNINYLHKRAEISYIIGQTEYWGKGAASDALSQIISLAREQYGLKKLYAGLADGNYASQRVLEKNKFVLEGRRLNHLFYHGAWLDQLDYGLEL